MDSEELKEIHEAWAAQSETERIVSLIRQQIEERTTFLVGQAAKDSTDPSLGGRAGVICGLQLAIQIMDNGGL